MKNFLNFRVLSHRKFLTDFDCASWTSFGFPFYLIFLQHTFIHTKKTAERWNREILWSNFRSFVIKELFFYLTLPTMNLFQEIIPYCQSNNRIFYQSSGCKFLLRNSILNSGLWKRSKINKREIFKNNNSLNSKIS